MKHQTWALTAAILLLAAMPSFADISGTNTNTVTDTLKVSVTVVDAVEMTLSTAAGGCAVTGAGGGADYNMSLGTVDALGLTAPACGSSFAPTTPGTTNSAYYTAYTITPIYTSSPVRQNPPSRPMSRQPPA